MRSSPPSHASTSCGEPMHFLPVLLLMAAITIAGCSTSGEKPSVPRQLILLRGGDVLMPGDQGGAGGGFDRPRLGLDRNPDKTAPNTSNQAPTTPAASGSGLPPGTHTEMVDGKYLVVPDGFHIERRSDGINIVPDATPSTIPRANSAPPTQAPPPIARTEQQGSPKSNSPSPNSIGSRSGPSRPPNIGPPERPERRSGTPETPSSTPPSLPSKSTNPSLPSQPQSTTSPSGTTNLLTVENVELSATTRANLVQIANIVGQPLTVSSGKRSAQKQAKAMFDKFILGDKPSLYRNQTAYLQIRREFEKPDSGRSREQIENAMAVIIERQMSEGIYISQHLTDTAADVSLRGLSESTVRKIVELAKKLGGRAIVEKKPPHIHLQFGASGPKNSIRKP